MMLASIAAVTVSLLPASGKLPKPLSPADGVHTFTYDSVQRRLPLIAEAVIENNQFPEVLNAGLKALASEIAAGEPLKPLDSTNDPDWDELLAPLLENGETWFSAPWWISENYFYKRMLELTDSAAGVGPSVDPFEKQKADSLAGSADAFKSACSSGLSESLDLRPLVGASLWGNLADLSLSAGAKLIAPDAASSGGGMSSGSSMMLCDETEPLCDALAACTGKEILIVLDNCGLELVSDLLLVDGLLRIVQPSRVVLHAKDRPVFVSDVQPKDLPGHVDWMAKIEPTAGAAMATRLNAALESGQLVVEAPSFYTGARAFWEMPDELRAAYESAAVVITKGDANYRRLLGDLHWAHDFSFSELTGAYWPEGTALAALRTCKSGVLVGVDPECEAAASADHPEKWLVAGLYGCVQYKP